MWNESKRIASNENEIVNKNKIGKRNAQTYQVKVVKFITELKSMPIENTQSLIQS